VLDHDEHITSKVPRVTGRGRNALLDDAWDSIGWPGKEDDAAADS